MAFRNTASNNLFNKNIDSISSLLIKSEYYFDTINDKNNYELLDAIDILASRCDGATSELMSSWAYSIFELHSESLYYYFTRKKNSTLMSFVINEFCFRYGKKGEEKMLLAVARYKKNYSNHMTNDIIRAIRKQFDIACY